MKELLTPRKLLVASVALATAAASARSLGPGQAEAWIGRPLEFSAAADFDGANPAEQCVSAQVHYGEQPVPENRVSTRVEAGKQLRVRVRADAPIDEPMVRIALRVGCRNSITRHYTVLSELLPEQAVAALARRPADAPLNPPQSMAAAVALPTAPQPLARTAPAPRAARRSEPAMQQAVLRPAARVEPALALKAAASSRPAPARSQAVAQAPVSRLKVEAWQPAADDPALLRVSAHLTEPAADAGGRAAAALLWRALNAPPQELLRTAAMLSQLEAEVASLRASAGRTHAEITALRRDSERSQPAGWIGQALPALAVLLAALVVGGGLFLYRTARPRLRTDAGEWTGGDFHAPLPEPAREPATAADVTTSEPPPAEAEPPQAAPLALPARLHAAPGGAAAPVAALLAVPAPAPAVRQELPPLDAPELRAQRPAEPPEAMRVSALAAAMQEAEFLGSLGLAGDAMDVLKTYLHDAATPAPLAWYELMRLCVEADDAAGLAAVRRRFQQLFGAEAPALEALQAPQGAEAFPQLLSELTAGWPGAVLKRIETRLFARPDARAPLTLQAWHDLLWLHEFAHEVQHGPDDSAHAASGPAPAAHEPGYAPWALEEAGLDVDLAHDDADVGSPSRFGLDLNLDEQAIEAAWNEAFPLLMSTERGEQASAARSRATAPLPELTLVVDPPAPEPGPEGGGDDLMSAVLASEGRRALDRR